jgi:hypothetical protein
MTALVLVLLASVGVDGPRARGCSADRIGRTVAQALTHLYRLSINISCNSSYIYRITITEAES